MAIGDYAIMLFKFAEFTCIVWVWELECGAVKTDLAVVQLESLGKIHGLHLRTFIFKFSSKFKIVLSNPL